MNARKKALINFIKSGAKNAEKWRKGNCRTCKHEMACFPGSIRTSKIRDCNHSKGLACAFVQLIETGIVIVNENFHPIKINLEELD